MYEANTYETILKRMLSKVPDSLDKREGSVIYTALAPAAAELAQVYVELDVYMKLIFASTSEGEYIDERAWEMGIERQSATKAVRRGIFYGGSSSPLDVLLGSRFSIEGLNYTVIGKIAPGQFELEAEIAGTAGNRPNGDMLPLEYIAGLVRAELADVLVEGADEESDEKLLERYQMRVRRPATSGNACQYRQWALEVPGVGVAKVFPLWNGPGTVKITIADDERRPASAALVSETEAYIENVRPIGAIVTVVPGSAKEVNVSANIEIASGYTLQGIYNSFASALGQYLRDIAFEINYVSYAKIGTLLLNTSGVLDYTSLSVNGGSANIGLADDEVPIPGTVDLGV